MVRRFDAGARIRALTTATWLMATMIVSGCLLEDLPSAATTQEPAPEIAGSSAVASGPDLDAFLGWLDARVAARGEGVTGLYYAYYNADTDDPWLLSTMVSAQVARFYLRLGDIDRARTTCDTLLGWQHDGSGPWGERLAGAFPSALRLDEDGQWAPDYLYDTADNLAVAAALIELYEVSGQPRYLDGALLVGAWVRDVMAHGEDYGVWTAALGAPMRAVTHEGAFDNRVPVGRTLFWLAPLWRLSELTGDDSFARVATDAYAFAALGQTEEGGYFDHYDPGWPPQPFDPGQFLTVGHDGAIYADDSLRAALGAAAVGDDASARSFLQWLQADGVQVHGYLSITDGTALFTPLDVPYYDVVASGLYRALLQRLDVDAAAATDFATRTQAVNGGWYWGWSEPGDEPLTADQATLTGLWSLMDLTPRGGSPEPEPRVLVRP